LTEKTLRLITRYLNVDLMIESESDLSAFVKHCNGKVVVLWNELTENLYSIGLETNHLDSSGPEEDIIELLEFIELMPSELQHLWKNCSKKVMDIGYECGTTIDTLDSLISANTLQKMAKAGCAINIRIYPYVGRPENPDDIIVVNE